MSDDDYSSSMKTKFDDIQNKFDTEVQTSKRKLPRGDEDELKESDAKRKKHKKEKKSKSEKKRKREKKEKGKRDP